MTADSVAKRPRTRFLVAVSGVAIVLVFFLAPIVPVDSSQNCLVTGPRLHYTDWQSPSYYLFKVGYQYTQQRVNCIQ